jgi:hypothetical protein
VIAQPHEKQKREQDENSFSALFESSLAGGPMEKDNGHGFNGRGEPLWELVEKTETS